MVYYKRRGGYRTKRYNRRRRVRRQSVHPYVDAGVKALRIATRLAGMINPELKFKDTALMTSAVNTWTFTIISQITQGTDENNRIGRSILCKGVIIRWAVSINASVTVPSRVRCVMFMDKMGNGALATSADVYTADSPQALRNLLTETGRFVILKDVTLTLDTISGGDSTKYIDWYVPMHTHIKYEGTGVTTADIGKNALYFGCVSDAAVNPPQSNGNARIRYYDN